MSELDFSQNTPFNDHHELERNSRWLHDHMSQEFHKVVSKPWQMVLANQMSLLKAHEGLDHLMSKNEACIMTTRDNFDDLAVAEIYKNHFIESFYRFSSQTSFGEEGILTIIFLKLTSSCPSKDLYEPEELVAMGSSLKTLNMNFITICPHSITSKLIKLVKFLGTKIHRFEQHITEFKEGYYIQITLELEKSLDEQNFYKSHLFLTSTFFLESIEKTFPLDHALLIDAIGVLCFEVLSQQQADRYSLKNIDETLVRYQELIAQVSSSFILSVDPKKPHTFDTSEFERKIAQLDSGNPSEDEKRKTILSMFVSVLKNTLKTNFYAKDKKALSFRINPIFLQTLPDLKDKFPEIPYGLFFMKGEGFFGFHIRFKDLSRGGLRTVLSRTKEQAQADLLNVFSECYSLSYTQQKKNKDIPEGGAKGIIFTDLYKLYEQEANKSLTNSENFFLKYRTFCQIMSQKRYILSFLDLINADDKGVLKNKAIIDLLHKPEFIFLGPDENMTDPMIEWIAETSLKKQYANKTAFISSKPKAGINHKTYGVTSYGVNAYMEEALKYLNINPTKDSFSVKISGGPDGDVAGNQMLNLKKYYPNTAKLVAITDVSGTIYDPEGLDLNLIEELFKDAKPIRFYPHSALKKGGYLLDLQTRKKEDLKETTLLVKNQGGKITEEYISGTEMNLLFRQNLHQVKADIFIPAGGRPRTLNDFNVHEFLDKEGKPTSKAIVEGANLYLTPKARRFLEEKGVIIFKDSSANKGGVICSSYEVLGGLCLNDDQFMAIKEELVKDILALIKQKAEKEAKLLLESLKLKMGYLTDLSDEVSFKINTFKYEILEALEKHPFPTDPQDPLNKLVITYVPAVIRRETSDKHILESLSEVHKKAIVACHLGSNVVYMKGLKWNPGIAELLPLLLGDKGIH